MGLLGAILILGIRQQYGVNHSVRYFYRKNIQKQCGVMQLYILTCFRPQQTDNDYNLYIKLQHIVHSLIQCYVTVRKEVSPLEISRKTQSFPH